ncbi:unnamed protein product [Gongylonema pulchrum]|uniref:FANCI_S4 domain-containing protein n=1 Tax=Gongylonema pulchrum TaxID=637853 RepID=A0A183DGR8_9BILA|nr:unnamed protein product [Gongylonema pulchrum]
MQKTGVKSEQLAQLLKTSVTWMIRRGKLERLVTWKYAKVFDLYDEATIKDIISMASVDLLENLLHSSSDCASVSSKFALYSTLAQHESEKKRKLLSTVLEDVLKVTVGVAKTDIIGAIRFLQHILPVNFIKKKKSSA